MWLKRPIGKQRFLSMGENAPFHPRTADYIHVTDSSRNLVGQAFILDWSIVDDPGVGGMHRIEFRLFELLCGWIGLAVFFRYGTRCVPSILIC